MNQLSNLYDIPVQDAAGVDFNLSQYRDRMLLIVNVASRCGLTDQYTDLQALQDTYGDSGLTVLAFPCNQFKGQEPGTAEEVKEFCSTTFGADFPVMAKIEVNGPQRHPLYDELTTTPDDDGKTGDVEWNFEKFLVAPGGKVLRRLRPRIRPMEPDFIRTIEQHLPFTTRTVSGAD